MVANHVIFKSLFITCMYNWLSMKWYGLENYYNYKYTYITLLGYKLTISYFSTVVFNMKSLRQLSEELLNFL